MPANEGVTEAVMPVKFRTREFLASEVVAVECKGCLALVREESLAGHKAWHDKEGRLSDRG